MLIRHLMPYGIYKTLWGDRKSFGNRPIEEDTEWKVWQKEAYTDFYPNTQQKGVGDKISQMGYPVVSRIDFSYKEILEVGPGIIRHLKLMKSKPAVYKICDVNKDILETAKRQLYESGIPHSAVLLDPRVGAKFPFEDESFDVIISFNSLEHLYPLKDYLVEFERILKPGGKLVGSFPCEGGLAWGLGRFLTTRRYVNNNYGINYDKIICWEHPNFADFIIEQLDVHFGRQYLRLHPLSWLPMDFNLVASFVYAKRDRKNSGQR